MNSTEKEDEKAADHGLTEVHRQLISAANGNGTSSQGSRGIVLRALPDHPQLLELVSKGLMVGPRHSSHQLPHERARFNLTETGRKIAFSLLPKSTETHS